ncbi:MAG: hypothetical protein SFW67_07330 [Myxococcaceae bacterium]|nr:hypothetical protein [Myxococcaceae bacterium]
MAGGANAAVVPCDVCLFDEGLVTRAQREREGVESDDYVCARGHRFGVEYRRGPASEPLWPPGPEVEAEAARVRGEQS